MTRNTPTIQAADRPGDAARSDASPAPPHGEISPEENARTLRRLRLDDRSDHRVLLPALSLAVLLVLLSDWVCLQWPLKYLVPALWVILPTIGVALIWVSGGLCVTRARLMLTLLAFLTAWFVLADICGRLAPGAVLSFHPDAWSYECFSDFLYHFSRNHSPLEKPLIDQYSAHLQNTRFGASALLAFLGHTPLTSRAEGVLFAHTAFYFLCLVVHFFAVVYFVRSLRRQWNVAAGAGVLATAGGWFTNAVIVGNYDNLLFVTLVPAWLGLAARFAAGTIAGWRFACAGAICLAALFNVYPEGFALLSVLSLPLLLHLLRSVWGDRRRALALLLLGVVTFVLVIPYLPVFVGFVRNQIADATQHTGAGLRPGSGNFVGLLDGTHALPAIFALGEELPNSSIGAQNFVLPLLLCALAGTGALALRRSHPWFPWVALCLLGLWLWQDLLSHYDYGTYKVLFCASWWIYPAVAVGLQQWVCRGENRPWAAAKTAVAFVLLLLAIVWEKSEDRPARVWQAAYPLESLRELPGLDRVIDRAPVLLGVDNDFEYLWAAVFLRVHPLGSVQLRSYLAMPHIGVLRAPAPEDCRYVLVSGVRPGALWHNARFSLLPNEQPQLVGIENPNGLESVAGEQFFWLSSRETVLNAIAPAEGDFELRATALLAGPSAPTSSTRRVEIEDAAGRRVVALQFPLMNPTPGIPVRLARGRNRVTLRCLEPATILTQPNGDKRELLLGVQGPRLVKIPRPTTGDESSAH